MKIVRDGGRGDDVYLSGRLEDDSIAGNEGRSQLRDGEVDRVVEWGNAEDDSEGNLQEPVLNFETRLFEDVFQWV